MQRRVLIIAVVLALVVVAGGFVLLKRPRPVPQPAARTTAPASVPRPAAPRAQPVPPASAGITSPAPGRRASKPAAAPAPASESVPDTATLHITSDVPGAQVFIDRQFVGAAPVTAEHVTPGTHQLNASVEGFDGIAETIDVGPGPRDIAVRFREVRLDATLAVVHKHRFGSCTGQLVATPQELRYDTSNKDDGFRVALGDVEALDVDYLQKNLRVKLRRGKQYNFTDPEGNADRLFVFQRDVDKARQRLARGDRPAEH